MADPIIRLSGHAVEPEGCVRYRSTEPGRRSVPYQNQAHDPIERNPRAATREELCLRREVLRKSGREHDLIQLRRIEGELRRRGWEAE